MSFFEENIRILRGLYPSFEKEILSRFSAGSSLEILPTPSGQPSARYRGRLIHSARSPMEEARRLAQAQDLAEASHIVIAGFGLGYLAEACLELNEGGHVIVFEPDIPLFLEAMHARPLSRVLGSPRFSLLLNAEPGVLYSLLPSHSTGPLKLVKYRPLYEFYKDYYDKVEAAAAAFILRRDINENTLKRFGKLWVRNMFANLPALPRAKPVASLYGILAGTPALVLAAGPSLDDAAPMLPELRERFLIVAVDTSLNACLAVGVIPDFLVVVDPQYWNLRHLDRLMDADTVLVSETSTHPGVFRRHRGDIFFCGSIFPLSRYFENAVGNLGKLGAGGSVATTAWDFARILGCNPILMAGLDLGFPGKATHYRGSFFETRSLGLAHRFLPAETMSFRYIHDALPYWEENNEGGLTLTDKRLSLYRNWFEQQFTMYPETKTLSLSPRGLRMRGLGSEDINKLPSYPCIRRRIDGLMAGVKSLPAVSATGSTVEGALMRLRQGLLEIKTFAAEAERLSEQLKQKIAEEADVEELIARLNETDRVLGASLARDIAGFLAQESARAILSRYRSRSGAETAESSCAMYHELSVSADYHLRLLDSSFPAVVGAEK